MAGYTTLAQHLEDLRCALASLRAQERELDTWGRLLADRLDDGRLLVAGNGGSAAEAQHLTAELVGRFEGERRPLSAICLHGDTSSLTAIGNDYGGEEIFARQVEAHGRPGDVLLLLTTSGRSRNLVEAAKRARTVGVAVWAMTGRRPNPVAELSDRVIAVAADSTSSIQEAHLVAVHAICAAVDRQLGRSADQLALDDLALDASSMDGQAMDGQAMDGQAMDGHEIDGQRLDLDLASGLAIGSIGSIGSIRSRGPR